MLLFHLWLETQLLHTAEKEGDNLKFIICVFFVQCIILCIANITN